MRSKRIVIAGGAGQIGSRLAARLSSRGHDVVAVSRRSGVNTVTGEGLDIVADAEVLIDVTNAPSFDDAPVMDFFRTSTRNLLNAALEGGVSHYIALSVVGTDRLQDSGYFRAKKMQEDLIRQSPLPYTIVRSTQFYEFADSVAASAFDGDTIRVPPVRAQPLSADDAAKAIAGVAEGLAELRIVEIAGPDGMALDEMVRTILKYRGDARTVTTDREARYFGARLDDRVLLPSDYPRFAPTSLDEWLTGRKA